MMPKIDFKNKMYALVCLMVTLIAIPFFPMHRIVTNEKADNPQGCPYYITLQSMLVNYPLLSYDRSNAQYIKNQMLKFEKNTQHVRQHADIVSSYRSSYLSVLSGYGVNSISKINDEKKIIAIAASSAASIDGYYLDSRLTCLNPLYFPEANHSRRILKYNFAGNYDQVAGRYLRVLGAMPNDSQLGVLSGVFVNNGSTTLTTQFITGMPMLTALYVLPEHSYAEVGSYSAMVPWNYFSPNILMSQYARKAMDVAGIDVFTFSESAKNVGNISGVRDISSMHSFVYPMFRADAVSYVNLRSYGMAYLANHIDYQDPAFIKRYEDTIKNYFANVYKRDPKHFREVTGSLYKMLMNLEHQRDIILETKQPLAGLMGKDDHPAGSVKTEGIVGERAQFTTNCLREQCALVVNIADTPGWKAFVNGKRVNIERANFAFMSVAVPSGSSSVWFIYSPYSESFSYFISIFTLIGVLLVSFGRKKPFFNG